MNDRLHAGVSALSACFVGSVLLVRYAVTGWHQGRHRAPRTFLRPAWAVAEVTVPCRSEGRNTVHARTAVRGELVCRSCGHLARGGVR